MAMMLHSPGERILGFLHQVNESQNGLHGYQWNPGNPRIPSMDFMESIHGIIGSPRNQWIYMESKDSIESVDFTESVDSIESIESMDSMESMDI
jgi:hypothetical protein